MIRYLGCSHCIHRDGMSCKAFPDGIPGPIASGEIPHDKPLPGDGGIIFTPTKDAAELILGLSLPQYLFDAARNQKRKESKSCGCCEKNGGGDPPAKPSERISGSDRTKKSDAKEKSCSDGSVAGSSGSSGGCDCGCARGKAISQKSLWADPDAPAGIMTKATRRDAEEEFEDITEDEKAIGGAVSKVLERQVAAVIDEINAAGAPTAELVQKVESLLRSAKWNEQIVTALRPYLQTALENGIGLGIETVSKMASVPNFTPNRDDLKAYAQSESVRLARRAATGVNRYTSVRVGEILGNGIAEGETIGQLASRVQDWAGEKGDAERATRRRALTIARTEAQRASRAAEVEAWRSTGLVEGKTWLLAPDPCEFCEAASKSFSDNAVGIEESFYKKGETLVGADGGELVLDYENVDGPPLHPNCRCSLQPKFVGELEDIAREIEADVGLELRIGEGNA